MSSHSPPDPTAGHPEQILRLFFSFDLVGASRFKYENPPVSALGRDAGAWPKIFADLFNRLSLRFAKNIRDACEVFSLSFFPKINFWKTLGDEILFHSEQVDEQQPYWLTRAFLQTVHEMHEEVDRQYNHRLGIKGTVWSAGFPIRNKRIFLDSNSEPGVFEGLEEGLAAPTGARPLSGAFEDFMGLEMDQGFRLAQHAYAGRAVCSPDACFLIARGFLSALLKSQGARVVGDGARLWPIATAPAFRVFVVGWKQLKGVLAETPVPILWPEFVEPTADSPESRPVRYLFEVGASEFIIEYKSAKSGMHADQYAGFFLEWNRSLREAGVAHVVPYISVDAIAADHRKEWLNSRTAPRVRLAGEGPE